MLDINIKTIPDGSQRYNTVGDYWKENGQENFRISDMHNWKYEILVGLHELVEESLCRTRGISEEAITAFDEQYEKRRKYGVLDEPGNDPSAPYHKEHLFATKIEKLVANELGVNWEEYNDAIVHLDDKNRTKTDNEKN